MDITVTPTGPILTALRQTDPTQWRAIVRAALERYQDQPGAIDLAATALGVDRTTLYRWLRADPVLRRGLDLPGPGKPTQ